MHHPHHITSHHITHTPITRLTNTAITPSNTPRTFKAFRMLARAVRRDPLSGADLAVAQIESEPFKVRPKP
jgi:hypothetical protein